MKLKIRTVHELISNVKDYFEVISPSPDHTNEEPLRSELFSADKLIVCADGVNQDDNVVSLVNNATEHFVAVLLFTNWSKKIQKLNS